MIRCGTRLVCVCLALGLLIFAGQPQVLAQDSRELAQAVKMRLEGSTALGFSRVDIDVKEGVVTLKGTLPTLYAIVEAEKIAGKVHGTLEIVNKIKLDGRRRSAGQLESKVRSAFAERLALSWADIKVKANRRGKVVLSGKVGDARLRHAAFKAAAQIEGVVTIVDNVVSPDAPDELIEKSLQGLFRRGDLVGISGDIEISVRNGTANLFGTVPRPYERMLATELALGVNGVRKVVNHLVVRPVSYDVPIVRPY